METKEALDYLKNAKWGCGFADPSDKDAFAEQFFDSVYSPLGPKYKVKHGAFRDLAADLFTPVTYGGTLYAYDPKTGLYYEAEEEIRACVTKWLDICCTGGLSDDFHFLPPSSKITWAADEIMKLIRSENVISGEESPFNHFNGIPVENGVIIFDENHQPHLISYTPEMLYTVKLAAPLDFEADTSRVLSVLTEWAGEYSCALVQAVAQGLLQYLPGMAPLKKTYFLTGPKNSGKTTYLQAVEKTAGRSCVSHITLQELSERFNAAELEGKMFNLGDDLSVFTLADCGAFKRISGKEWHSVEEKYKKRHLARLTAVHIFTANKLPKLSRAVASDDAFWERVCIIPFCGNFTKSCGFSGQVFSPAFACGLLLLAVQTVSQILASGGGLLYEQDIDEVRNLWEGESTPLADYLEEATVKDDSGHVEKAALLAGLQEYAKANGLNKSLVPDSINALTREMTRLGYAPYNLGRKKIPCYKGLSWKTECSPSSSGNLAGVVT
ncbi:MAG TPA: DUF5906 domain-containing protein [Methanocorpusculum sp.]|nr:DUF5906 domain-containing protein [Methanocorpusculum sp.]